MAYIELCSCHFEFTCRKLHAEEKEGLDLKRLQDFSMKETKLILMKSGF